MRVLKPSLYLTVLLSIGLLSGCGSGGALQGGLDAILVPEAKSGSGSKGRQPERYDDYVDNALVPGSLGGQSAGNRESINRGSGQFLGDAKLFGSSETVTGGDGITLNLVEVPITEAAKSILGDILKLNYTISDKVAGKLTIQTTTAIPREALADAFDAALRVSGFALVHAGGFYRLVPAAEAGNGGLTATLGRNRHPVGAHVRIVPLRHVSAREMRRVLEPVAAQGAIVYVDNSRNILFLAGQNRELDDLGRLIELFDVDWLRGMSFAFFPVQSSDPEAIAKELETIYGLDEDGPLKGVVRFVPNQRLGSVLVISKNPEHLDKAGDWVKKLDNAAGQTEDQLFVYKIQNRPAAQLAEVLQRVLSTEDDGSNAAGAVAPRYESETTVSAAPNDVPQGPQGAPLIGSLDSPSGRTSDLNSSSQPSPANRKSFIAGNIRVVADEANNALLIQAVPRDYEKILKMLKRLDVAPTQVMLEAVIAEISLNDELRFGLKWFLEKKQHSFTLSDALSGAVASAFPGFSYFFSAASTQVVLDALSGITKVNVVSAPSLMVMDNRKATLQIGDQVPIITQTAQSVTSPDSPVVNSVELKDTGVIFSIVPRVNDSGRVVLEIEQEVSNVVQTTSSGIDSPTIQQRRVNTTVVVSDGEVIALGGLIQQRDTVSKTQVPILGDLPVVGAAFRQKEDVIDRTELVIFIRPQVVRNRHEAEAVTDEFRSRLDMQRLQPTEGDRHYRRDVDRILR